MREISCPTDVLNVNQRYLLRIISELNFGVVEELLIREGAPRFDSAPRITQTIKLDSDLNRPPDSFSPSGPLKKEFENLFVQLSQLPDCFVDIEVRHGLPFRLIVEWPRAHSGGSEESR